MARTYWKYTKETADKLLELYATGEYSITACCEAVGISRESFYKWKQWHKSFIKQLEKIEHERLGKIKEVATTGLMMLLRGKEFEEVTTEYVQGKPKEDGSMPPPVIRFQRKTKKFIFPSPAAVIFTLKNLDPDNFQDVFRNEISGKGGVPLAPMLNIQTIESTPPILESEIDITGE